MRFYFLRSIQPESIYWFSLQCFIYKICSLKTPAFRNLMSFDLNLFCQNCIPDLLPWFSNIRSFPKHALIRNDSYSKIINSDTVILAAHDFRSHVTRSSRCVFRVVRIPDSGDTEICEAEVSVFFKHQILRFDIPMDNSFVVNILKR